MTKRTQARSQARSGSRALGARKIVDSRPDVHRLFVHYNDLYFASGLGDCSVEWSSRKTSLAGDCVYGGGRCRIRLSEPILKTRSFAELKSTLLHEMIHAHLFVTKENIDHNDHGDLFRLKVDQIKKSKLQDEERPEDGYGIRLQHSLLEGNCSESRACEDVQEIFLDDTGIDCRDRLMKKDDEGSDLLTIRARDDKELPKVSCKRTNSGGDTNKIFKVPRLDLFYGKRRDLDGKGKNRKASFGSIVNDTKALPKASTVGKLALRMPDVIIGWKNWCALEPEEHEERLIDRRLERRLAEKARISTKCEKSKNQTGQSSKPFTREMVEPGEHARSTSSQADHESMEIVSPGSLAVYQGDREVISSGGLELEVYQGGGEMVLSRGLEQEASREIVSPGSLVLYQGNREINGAGPSHGYRDATVIDLDAEERDYSLALVPVLKVAPLKVYERRRDREQKKKTQLERRDRPPLPLKIVEAKARAPVPISTVCPICSTVFGFDTTKAEDNAKFNTHIDLCLNGRLRLS